MSDTRKNERHQELAEQEEQYKCPGQQSQPDQPRAFMLTYHRHYSGKR
jgi:hypothetical protein